MPDSFIPDEIPNFVGRDKECKAVERHLTDGVTRLVNVWGPPGFGKTSVAIMVAHDLQEKGIPVHFVSVRGMESKEDLVSKLLSMFADNSQVRHISSSHFSIQCLQQVQNAFVLILDNADDLLESGDTRRKEHVLQFIDEILTHCKQIKLLLTTRGSLDYLKHKLPMYSEKINVLDKTSSEDLVRLLLPDVSDDDCNYIVRECGNVPMSMRLICSIIKEASISIDILSQELNNSTLVSLKGAGNMISPLLQNNTERAAFTYYALGEVQRDTGDLKGAMESLQSAVNIRLNLLGDHRDTALAYYKLGLVQLDMKDINGALDSLEKAAHMESHVLGDSEDTARSYYWLCVVQKKAGDLKNALASVQVSLRLRRKLLGDHPDTADSFYEQGTIHFAMGDFKAAVQALQKAADININLHIDHISTAHSYHDLHSTQNNKDRQERTLDSLKRAAHITSDLLGDHEDTASSYHELGLVQRDMEDLKGVVHLSLPECSEA